MHEATCTGTLPSCAMPRHRGAKVLTVEAACCVETANWAAVNGPYHTSTNNHPPSEMLLGCGNGSTPNVTNHQHQQEQCVQEKPNPSTHQHHAANSAHMCVYRRRVAAAVRRPHSCMHGQSCSSSCQSQQWRKCRKSFLGDFQGSIPAPCSDTCTHRCCQCAETSCADGQKRCATSATCTCISDVCKHQETPSCQKQTRGPGTTIIYPQVSHNNARQEHCLLSCCSQHAEAPSTAHTHRRCELTSMCTAWLPALAAADRAGTPAAGPCCWPPWHPAASCRAASYSHALAPQHML